MRRRTRNEKGVREWRTRKEEEEEERMAKAEWNGALGMEDEESKEDEGSEGRGKVKGERKGAWTRRDGSGMGGDESGEETGQTFGEEGAKGSSASRLGGR